MGAKTWMLAYCDGKPNDVLRSYPELDRAQSETLAKRLFPATELEQIADGDLSYTCPPEDEIYVGCFPGLSIVAASEFGLDYPSSLPSPFLSADGKSNVYLHAMHSVVDWFAYAVWEDGRLQRSLSLSPDSGILEDLGERAQFEKPYWSGEFPALDPEEDDSQYPLPFHPLELGEAALADIFGYQIEGFIDPEHLEPENIALVGFRRHKIQKKPWWRFW